MDIPAKARGLATLQRLGLPALAFQLLPDGSQIALADVRAVLERAARDLAPAPHGYSLRSATWSEDGAHASRAGQFISFNGLAAVHLPLAAQAIWRHRDRVSPGEECFLILQPTHASYVSGVAAVMPGRNIVIECSYGSCRNVTDGLSQPTRMIYDVSSAALTVQTPETREASLYWAHRSLIASRPTRTPGMALRPSVRPFIERPRLLADGSGGEILLYGRPRPIPVRLIERIVSTLAAAERQLRELGGTAMGLDLEWSADRDEKIVFLQLRSLTRPIPSSAVIAGFDATAAGQLRGLAASPGTAVGEVVHGWPDRDGRFIVAVADATVHDVSLLKRAKGLLSLTGGLLSHTAIVCRELRIPYVANLPALPPAGRQVLVDGNQGVVSLPAAGE
jgi:phosphoenolpyruvate synthase/pyruvate phosphate dikinase